MMNTISYTIEDIHSTVFLFVCTALRNYFLLKHFLVLSYVARI